MPTLNQALRQWAAEFELPYDEMLGYALQDSIGGQDTGWPGGSIWSVGGQMLYALIRVTGIRDVLELGTGHGCSASHIARALKDNGGGKITTINKPDSADAPRIAEDLLPFVEFVKADGLDWIARYEGEFDLIFEDGPHTMEFTNIAAGRSVTRLRPGGFLIVHDVHGSYKDRVWPGLKAALPDAKRILVLPSWCGLGYWRKPTGGLIMDPIPPPLPGASRSFYDGMPDYQRHAGSNWDFEAATQFALMFFLGLLQHHFLLDIGCGSLRAGRLLATYLLPGHYYGLDPVVWPREAAIAEEMGQDWLKVHAPVFSDGGGFDLGIFGQQFDFLLAHSIFTHATQAQVRKCLSEAKEVMRPTGVFAATYFEGEDNTNSEWAWPHCVYYRSSTMAQFVEEAGLIAGQMDWPLFGPAGNHVLLLIVRPEAKERLGRILAVRKRGEVTMLGRSGKE